MRMVWCCVLLAACEYPRPPDVPGDDGLDDAGTDADGMVDDSRVDAPIDVAVAPCPANYSILSGGEANHVYRVTSVTNIWQTTKTNCSDDHPSSYLAIPNSSAEIIALNNFQATDTQWWIGVNDMALEDTYVNVKGTVQTFLPWRTNEPDDLPNPADCVAVNQNNNQLSDIMCTTMLRGICECEEP